MDFPLYASLVLLLLGLVMVIAFVAIGWIGRLRDDRASDPDWDGAGEP